MRILSQSRFFSHRLRVDSLATEKTLESNHEKLYPGPEDYTAAACLREDALNALAARDEVRREIGEREWRELRAEFLDVLELDYCKVFAA